MHIFGGGVAPTCATRQNAIWSRPGVIYDSGTDRIFMGTGNAFNGTLGQFDGNHNWSESVIALHPDGSGGNTGKPLDSYTPTNHISLDSADADVGSTAPAILPVPANSRVQHLAVQGGKDATLRLLNLQDLSGRGGPGNVGGEVGSIINVPQGGQVLSQPAVWVNPADGSTWIFVVNGNGASGLRLNFDASGNPSLSTQWHNGQSGTSPVIANNMVFSIGGSTVRALDPVTGNQLWSAALGGGTHWQSVIVANGVVYATDQANHLAAFGLAQNPAPTITVLASSSNPSNAGTSVTFTATVTGTLPSGNVSFSEAGTALTGCSPAALIGAGNARTAACTTSTLSVGTHGIVAAYGGDAGNSPSSSAPLSQVVNASSQINVALASNGGVASASSTLTTIPGYSFPVASVNNNERAGVNWGNGGGWADGTNNSYPDWVEIDFNGSKTIDHVVVYTVQDNWPNPVEPTDTMTFSQWGITAFTVQGWIGGSWITLGSVSGNNLVKRTVSFITTTTDRIRINITNALAGSSRITEIEAWGVNAGPAQINVALASNGGVASASSTLTTIPGYSFPVASVNNNERAGVNWGNGGGWADGTNNSYPDWVEIDFNGSKTIDHVVVYTVQDNWPNPVEPTDTMTFSQWGVTAFTVQGWIGGSWITLGSVSGNNFVKRTVSFITTATDRIRINITNALAGSSRITEIEAWGS